MVTPPHRPLLAPSLIQVSSKYLRAGRCGRVSQVALVGKNLSANAAGVRDVGLIPGLGRYPGGGNGNPLQCLCLENPVDGAQPGRVAKSQTRLKRLSTKHSLWQVWEIQTQAVMISAIKKHTVERSRWT